MSCSQRKYHSDLCQDVQSELFIKLGAQKVSDRTATHGNQLGTEMPSPDNSQSSLCSKLSLCITMHPRGLLLFIDSPLLFPHLIPDLRLL